MSRTCCGATAPTSKSPPSSVRTSGPNGKGTRSTRRGSSSRYGPCTRLEDDHGHDVRAIRFFRATLPDSLAAFPVTELVMLRADFDCHEAFALALDAADPLRRFRDQ